MKVYEVSFFTAEEVAKLLRCTPTFVYRIMRGEVKGVAPIPVLKFGRRRLVRQEALAEWINTNYGVVETNGTAKKATLFQNQGGDQRRSQTERSKNENRR